MQRCGSPSWRTSMPAQPSPSSSRLHAAIALSACTISEPEHVPTRENVVVRCDTRTSSMEASPPWKIEWALACDQVTVTEHGAIEQLGRPFKRTFVSAPFPVDGINLELPVIIMFSDVAEEGIRDFIF